MLAFLKAWFLTRVARDEKGQDAAEYALLIGLIALVLIVGVGLLGTNLNQLFTDIANEVAGWF